MPYNINSLKIDPNTNTITFIDKIACKMVNIILVGDDANETIIKKEFYVISIISQIIWKCKISNTIKTIKKNNLEQTICTKVRKEKNNIIDTWRYFALDLFKILSALKVKMVFNLNQSKVFRCDIGFVFSPSFLLVCLVKFVLL